MDMKSVVRFRNSSEAAGTSIHSDSCFLILLLYAMLMETLSSSRSSASVRERKELLSSCRLLVSRSIRISEVYWKKKIEKRKTTIIAMKK